MDHDQKKTMTVPELRQMLGLQKTDSYWLVHKQCFKTTVIGGQMRIDLESFEHWYANQIKYKKVNGPPPGEELKAYSYSVRDLAEELDISDSVIYDIINREGLETFKVDFWTRIRKDVFEEWYKNQNRYRTKADRARDAELEESSISMPEMARLLLVSRSVVYNILKGRDRDQFEFITVAEKRRITKESFERWYAGQEKYRKLHDRSPKEIAEIERNLQIERRPRLKVDESKSAFSLQETAVLLDVTYNEVRRMIQFKELEARKCGVKYLVPKDEIHWYLLQQSQEREEEKGEHDNGNNRSKK